MIQTLNVLLPIIFSVIFAAFWVYFATKDHTRRIENLENRCDDMGKEMSDKLGQRDLTKLENSMKDLGDTMEKIWLILVKDRRED